MSVARRDQLALLLVALAVDAIAAFFVATPGYMDAAYYFGGALRLVRGDGLSEPYLWNYLSGVSSLPAPGFLYWMPLTSLVAAGGMALFGPTFRAAQAPFVVLAALVPALAYRIGLSVTGDRKASLLAGLLAIFSAFYVVFWPNTDAFALYALLGALALWAAARGMREGRARWYGLAGVLSGLAQFARADGVLLLVAVLWGALQRGPGSRRQVARSAGAGIAGYLLVLCPWLARNVLNAGSPFAPGASRTLWLTEYNDLFVFPASSLTMARYFSQGLTGIVRGKLWAAGQNLQTIVAVEGLIFLAPFIAVGLWQLRRDALYGLVVRYAALLYLAMTFVFTFPGARGGLLHSGVALLPFFMPAGVVGLHRTLAWVAARRSNWNLPVARRVFGVASVVLAVGLTGLVFYTRLVLGNWSYFDGIFAQVGEELPAGSLVASNNPPGVFAASGHGGVFIPNGGPEMLMAVVEQYGVDYVLLDANRPAQLAPLYRGEIRPAGLCPPAEPVDGVFLFAVAPCDE